MNDGDDDFDDDIIIIIKYLMNDYVNCDDDNINSN